VFISLEFTIGGSQKDFDGGMISVKKGKKIDLVEESVETCINVWVN
jgi:hypothetical protein